MTGRVLVLRPQPGAEATAVRARALGLDPVVAPLFAVEPLAWKPPEPDDFDAVLVTSANAVRCAGDGLTSFLRLPCYAVGETSAAAARQAGFADVRTGPADGAALVAMMATQGVRSAFHPSGADRRALEPRGLRIEVRPVYAARPLPRLPVKAEAALEVGALALLHSPRAAARFAELVDEHRRGKVAIAAISPAAAGAAGPGWRSVSAAPRPRDEALLELAAKLCQTGDDDE